ncbi:MAG: hypothetical protein HY672_00640 [Chloroflexi bacterium]|nr:hypothetical protein [Chloroflexota bacterium]
MSLKITEPLCRWLRVLNSRGRVQRVSLFLALLLMVCGGMFLVVNTLSDLFAGGTLPGAVVLVVTVSIFSVLYGTIAARILGVLGVSPFEKTEL